jgi:hypothetical protein
MNANPYAASKNYHPTSYWADSFAKREKIVYLLFKGDRLLARVKNAQQTRNLLDELQCPRT